jgi:hypothetical protein
MTSRPDWGTTADPLPAGWDDFEKALSEGGYTQCHSFGEENDFKIEGYWNGGKENFLITICDFSTWHPVLLPNLPSYMEFLRLYSPISQSAHLTLLGETLLEINDLLFHEGYGMFKSATQEKFAWQKR